jgi:hypothetical protein
MLRPTVSRPVCLGIKHPYGAYDQIFIILWQLWVCWFGAPSLMRGRVCRLQLLLVLASAVIFGSESHRTRVSDWRLPFSSPPTPRGVTVEVFDPASTRVYCLSLSLMLWPAVSRPVCLGVKHPSGAYDQIFITCVTVTVLFLWGALSDERSGLSFVCAPGPCQRSFPRVRVPWDLRPYFTVSHLKRPFRRLLRLAGSRWRYSIPPPHGEINVWPRIHCVS